jgi:hypothetical protein
VGDKELGDKDYFNDSFEKMLRKELGADDCFDDFFVKMLRLDGEIKLIKL